MAHAPVLLSDAKEKKADDDESILYKPTIYARTNLRKSSQMIPEVTECSIGKVMPSNLAQTTSQMAFHKSLSFADMDGICAVIAPVKETSSKFTTLNSSLVSRSQEQKQSTLGDFSPLPQEQQIQYDINMASNQQELLVESDRSVSISPLCMLHNVLNSPVTEQMGPFSITSPRTSAFSSQNIFESLNDPYHSMSSELYRPTAHHTLAAPTTGTVLPPPHPAGPFSFGSFTNNVNNNSNATFGFTGYDSSAKFSFGAPQPPLLSLAPTISSFGLFGSNVSNNNNASFGSTTFDGSTMFPAVSQPLPPPPPPDSDFFQNNTISNKINAFPMQQLSSMQDARMINPILPTPSVPTIRATTALLASTSLQPQPLFSFNAPSSSTTINAEPLMAFSQPMLATSQTLPVSSGFISPSSFSQTFEESTHLSSNTLFKSASLTGAVQQSSIQTLPDVDKIQTKSEALLSCIDESASSDHEEDHERSENLSSIANFFSLSKKKMANLVTIPRRGRYTAAPVSTSLHSHYKPALQNMRLTDTRCDEQERMPNSPIKAEFRRQYAEILNAKTCNKTGVQDLLLLDVTPLSLGIEDINGHMCIIITRNQTIPLRTKFYPVFTNAYAYQTTATIRVFRGEHKLTKYNICIGEFSLTGLTPNFASQTLEISICMDIDANGLLQIEAEESRSGAKTKLTIDPKNLNPLNKNDIYQHLAYVESNPDFRALRVDDRRPNDSLYMLKGETTNAKVSFTGESGIFNGFSTFNKLKPIDLTSTKINELKRIQLINGAFDLNQDFADLLSFNIKDFDELKIYLNKQGFNSFALNIQHDIIHLISTGIILLVLLFQVPVSDRNIFLVLFDSEQIRLILHRHLPKILLENIDKAINIYERKRLQYGIYCEQLELNYSTWEKFIQHSIFQMN
ncbi:unnamed protein product [Rotaria sp. Silwood2]|nr:unnamed protein product [Rotaria sp. Silwood2]